MCAPISLPSGWLIQESFYKTHNHRGHDLTRPYVRRTVASEHNRTEVFHLLHTHTYTHTSTHTSTHTQAHTRTRARALTHTYTHTHTHTHRHTHQHTHMHTWLMKAFTMLMFELIMIGGVSSLLSCPWTFITPKMRFTSSRCYGNHGTPSHW